MSEDAIHWAVAAAMVGAFLLFKRLGQITSEKARGLVATGAKLIDVRSPGEFATGHLPGAVNVPLPTVAAQADSLGPKDQPVIVYCASGTRSAMARSALKRQGFTQVYNLGAMSRW